MCGVSYLFTIREKQFTTDGIKNESRVIAEGFSAGIGETELTPYNPVLKQRLIRARKIPNVLFVGLFDGSGKCLLHTDREAEGLVLADEVSRKAIMADGTLVQDSKYEGRMIFDITVPLLDGAKKKGFVRIGYSLEALDVRLERGYYHIAVLTLLFLILGVVISIWLSVSLLRSVTDLVKGAKEITKGNLSYRTNVLTKDEMGILAGTFNEMAESLQVSRNELEKYSKTLEEKVGEKTKELVKANRELDELSRRNFEFATNVTHEIRSPLSSIKMGVERILNGLSGETNDKQRHILSRIIDNLNRMNRLINAVLDFSKLESKAGELRKSEVDIGLLIKHVLETIRFEADKKSIVLEGPIPDKLPCIYADSDKVIQVLYNLVDNAVKFTLSGGRVTVKARVIKESVKDKDIDVLEICIIDTGIGIKDEDIGKLFKEFQQVGNNNVEGRDGTGLGLAIARKIVSAHGGRIWAESPPNPVMGEEWIETDNTKKYGSKFVFTLPINRGEECDEKVNS